MNEMLLTPKETDDALNKAKAREYPELCDALCKEQHKKTANLIIKEFETYFAPHSGMFTINKEVLERIKMRWLKE